MQPLLLPTLYALTGQTPLLIFVAQEHAWMYSEPPGTKLLDELWGDFHTLECTQIPRIGRRAHPLCRVDTCDRTRTSISASHTVLIRVITWIEGQHDDCALLPLNWIKIGNLRNLVEDTGWYRCS